MVDFSTPDEFQAQIFPAQPTQKGIGWRCSSMAALLSLICSSPISAEQLLGEDAASIPIFDVHVHYHEPAWQPFPPESVITIFDQNRVAMALVSSSPDDGTLALWEHSPERIVPELAPYHGDWTNQTWMSNDGMEDYLTTRLAENE